MYYVRTDSVDIAKMLPIFFGILIGLLVVALAIYSYVKRQDNNKELITKNVKVLEKPVQQGNFEWYVLECESGERLKLRNFQANKVMITVGDVGVVSYRGQTIQDFKRKVQ